MDIHGLTETTRKGLVPHERFIPLKKFGRVFAQPRLNASITPEDLTTRTDTETAIHIAFKVFEEPTKPDLRFRGRPARGEGGAQDLRRRAGIRRRTARDGTTFRREGTATGVVTHIVAGTADPALEAIDLVGETTPQTAEPPQIGNAERKLEGNVWMVQEKVRLLVVKRFCVVDESTVIGFRIPETAGFPASPARTGLRDGVIQFARARVGDVSNPSRARVEEVTLDPRSEIRTHGPRNGTWNIPQTQPRVAARRPRPFVDVFFPRRAERPLFRPFHVA